MRRSTTTVTGLQRPTASSNRSTFPVSGRSAAAGMASAATPTRCTTTRPSRRWPASNTTPAAGRCAWRHSATSPATAHTTPPILPYSNSADSAWGATRSARCATRFPATPVHSIP
ncbi:CRISPR-associated protein Cas5 [Jeongeupia chitinilytica]|uniref:CRISPR-associated protein Cas5 n=1 Tax=Jeongeupia chitinilytica TaxID=1041641 RepID=UPI0035715CF9